MSPSSTAPKPTKSSSPDARFQVRYVYTDIVMKRNGRWQIVASRLAMPS
jgi:hypothetical protein